MHIPEKQLYPIQAAMEQWTDGREIDRAALECLLLFLLKVPNVLSEFGITWKGFVSRQKGGQTLMSIKVLDGDTPLVAFITGSSTIGCVSRFLDLWEDDKLTWVKDRYPWI